MEKKTVLTGIKPTGKLTLGNYIGVLRNLKKMQEDYECYFFVADLHALTIPIDPKDLHDNTRDLVAFYLASGLDTSKCHIFLQSMVSEHAELNAIMMNYLYMGELSRMTQFKDHASKMKKSAIGLGIFSYPVLMACDIVLYDADIIPVGEDQVQHVELTRTLVHRFNEKFNTDILKEPNAVVGKTGKRIMSLSDPTRKMSKSDPKGDIFLKDDEKTIRKKIMSATTDSGSDIIYDRENKPGISNLLTIYASLKDISIEEAEAKFKDVHQYGAFKKEVADAVCAELIPFQQKYNEILKTNAIDDALNKGAIEAKKIASETLSKVKNIVGIYETKK
jgi:tryptophanyl-tRNA synthetase